jgi:protein SCO1/2
MSRLRFLLLFLLPLLALGCSGEASTAWNGHDITGLMPDLEFELTDQNGERVTAQDYRGKVKLMFFGYTSCRHVCPVALSKLAEATRALGDQADRVEILFVAVDPKRDKPVLDEYVSHFDAPIVGLTGSGKELKRLARRYRVAFSYEKPREDGFYVVNHSAAVFVFGPEGRSRLLIDSQAKPAAISADLRRLIEQGNS